MLPFDPEADGSWPRKQQHWQPEDRVEVHMIMAQLLRAVGVGLTLAVTTWLVGLPDWLAAIPYVIGMGVTLARASNTSSSAFEDAC